MAGALDGQVAIVTGGGRGIGRGIAAALAAAGAAVAVAARSAEQLADTVAAIEAAGGRGLGVAADVRDAGAVAAAFDAVESALGPVTVLVNNAAGNFQVPAEKLSANGWRAVTGIVLDGTFTCSREFAQRRIAADAPVRSSTSGPPTAGPGDRAPCTPRRRRRASRT